jgi:hypothetical protein|tara:strand:+ start:406 stop:1071 length:666 start_codon:yes stop_codon:yes gene_type:complete
MKLTAETINILKNYATINQNIQFNEGNKLSTISPQKNILTHAEISENVPSTFAIYDLNKFLGALSLFNDPELNVEESKVNITGAGYELNYVYADPTMLVLPPEKTLDFPDPEIKFKMSKEDYDSCIKGAQVLSLPELVVEGDGSKIHLVATDTSNSSTDDFRKEVGTTDAEFQMVFKLENMKLLSGEYQVGISSKGIAHFRHETSKLQYWIATEQNSNYKS